MIEKVISFDMDGTLLRNTNSMELVCGLNGRLDVTEKVFYQIKEEKSIDWINGDFQMAEAMNGASYLELDAWFETHTRVISGLEELLCNLKKQNMAAILITSGPRQVAECFKRRYAFDEVYGSDYEVADGQFTGKITKHLMHDGGKYGCVLSFCKKHALNPEQVIVIGDSYSDIELFQKCRNSISLNAEKSLLPYAKDSIKTENIMDLWPLISKYG